MNRPRVSIATSLRRAVFGGAALALGLNLSGAAIPAPTELEERQALSASYASGAPVNMESFKAQQEVRQQEIDPQGAEFSYPWAWDTATRIIYVEAGAFDVDILISGDPEINCGIGCYWPGGHSGSEVPLIVIDPAMDHQLFLWTTHHELAHHLQTKEGTRFVDDMECDANLWAMELMGKEALVDLGSYCKDAGIALETLSIERLAQMELEHRD